MSEPAPNSSNRNIAWLFYWLPLVLWLLLTFALSTTIGSYEHSISMIYAMLTFLVPDAPAPPIHTIYGIVHIFRRSAYVFVYGGMALLLIRAVQSGAPRLKRRGLIATSFLGFLVAGIDNIVRSHTPERHGGWDDFTFSAGSILIFTGCVSLFFKAKQWEREWFTVPDTKPSVVE